MTDTHPSPLMTVIDAAAYLKISRTSMYRLLSNGSIPTVKFLKRGQFIEKHVLDELIAKSHSTSRTRRDA